MSKKQEVTELIEAKLTQSSYSPYRVGKIESVLRGKVIPPQKIYGYVRQGYINSTKNELGKMVIDREEVLRYLTKTMLNNN